MFTVVYILANMVSCKFNFIVVIIGATFMRLQLHVCMYNVVLSDNIKFDDNYQIITKNEAYLLIVD